MKTMRQGGEQSFGDPADGQQASGQTEIDVSKQLRSDKAFIPFWECESPMSASSADSEQSAPGQTGVLAMSEITGNGQGRRRFDDDVGTNQRHGRYSANRNRKLEASGRGPGERSGPQGEEGSHLLGGTEDRRRAEEDSMSIGR